MGPGQGQGQNQNQGQRPHHRATEKSALKGAEEKQGRKVKSVTSILAHGSIAADYS